MVDVWWIYGGFIYIYGFMVDLFGFMMDLFGFMMDLGWIYDGFMMDL